MMTVHLGFKRVKRNFGKTAFSSFSVLISSFIIALFSILILVLSEVREFFSKELSGVTSSDKFNDIISLSEFTREIFSYLTVALFAVVILTLFSIYVFIQLRADENKKFYATLESIGATHRQRRTVMLTELCILYLCPALVGSITGAVIGKMISLNVAKAIYKDFKSNISTAVVVLVLYVIFAILSIAFVFLTDLKRRKSAIESLKLYNRDEADKSHSYRSSNTFRSMPIEKRVAKKAVEYYKRSYRRISVVISGCTSYLVLAIIFLVKFSSIRVAVDDNPYDNIDTSAFSTYLVNHLMLLTTLSLFLLFMLSVGQIIMMIKAQSAVRRRSMLSYKSVGMTDTGTKKVLRYEYSTVIYNSLIYTIFLFIAVAFLFGI